MSKRPDQSIDATTEAEVVLAFKEQHYGSWSEVPLPALDGKTPPAAAKSTKLRPRLLRLLVNMAAHEPRAPARQRYDFSMLRADLGA